MKLKLDRYLLRLQGKEVSSNKLVIIDYMSPAASVRGKVHYYYYYNYFLHVHFAVIVISISARVCFLWCRHTPVIVDMQETKS